MSINNYLRNETAQFLPTLKDGASLGNEVKTLMSQGKSSLMMALISSFFLKLREI